MDILEEFGMRLRHARQGKSLTMREFAEAIGASLGSIPGYENGENDPRMSLIIKMADVLDVSVAWLMTGSPVIDLGTDPERAKKIMQYIRFLDHEKEGM